MSNQPDPAAQGADNARARPEPLSGSRSASIVKRTVAHWPIILVLTVLGAIASAQVLSAPPSDTNEIIAAGTLLGCFVVGVALAALRGMLLDDRIFDPSEIEPLGVGPVLGVIPRATRRKRGG